MEGYMEVYEPGDVTLKLRMSYANEVYYLSLTKRISESTGSNETVGCQGGSSTGETM